LFFDASGDLIACADAKNELWRIKSDKSHQVLLQGYEGKLFNGPNDVWIAGDGAYFFTDPFYKRPYWQRPSSESELPQRVYRLSADGSKLTVAAEGFKQPNGIVGDAAKQLLFVADIRDNKTYRFRISEQGELTDRQLFCEQGSDGMTLDSDGNVYLTGRAGVTVYDADGQKIQVISVPENWTANVCFGGTDRKTLFVTASDSIYTIAMVTTGL
jgi:gluconolactonase